MTVSDKVLAANRANARKSTGPRSKRGKNRVRMNALRHGFFAHGLLLTEEDRGEFDQLRESIIKTLSPRDPVELMLCERVVSACWRLRRLQTIENVTHHTTAAMQIVEREAPEDDQPEPVRSPDDEAAHLRKMEDEMMSAPGISQISMGLAKGDDLMDRLSRYEIRLDMLIHRSMRQLQTYRKQSRSGARDESAELPLGPEDANRCAPRMHRKTQQNVRNKAASEITTCARPASLGNPTVSR
jgi:hypothetical protein